jgi:hypothetical protein
MIEPLVEGLCQMVRTLPDVCVRAETSFRQVRGAAGSCVNGSNVRALRPYPLHENGLFI